MLVNAPVFMGVGIGATSCVRIYTRSYLYRFIQLLKIDAVINPHDNDSMRSAASRVSGLCIGIDLVQISAIEASIKSFGAHFMQRIFSDEEIAYALRAPALTAQRLAARFAAKEAAMKAFGLSEAGVGWRDIEVLRHDNGACSLQLHRKAAEIAASTGCTQIALSLSHDGDYATAMVAAQVPH